jgi:hypothetical protein
MSARGDTLIIYKSMILSVFQQCIHVVHKDSYEAMGKAAKNLLKSLSYVYPIDYRLTVENIEEPFLEFLPIRVSHAICQNQCEDLIFIGLGTTCRL